MHFSTHVLGDVPFLPSKRSIRRIQRRLPRYKNTLFPLFAAAVLTFGLTVFLRTRLPNLGRSGASSLLSLEKSGLASCANVPITRLSSFDDYILAYKATGRTENSLENRWQEDVWDTLLHPYALFPAWSDMRWNVPQYARGLGDDLALVQALAAKALYLGAKETLSALPAYRSPASEIHVNYVHHRLDRLRGLQYAVNFSPRQGVKNETVYNLLVQKSLDDSICRVALASSSSGEPVYILLPYSKREKRLRLFFQNILFLRTQYQENLVLIVSILRGNEDDERYVHELKEEIFSNAGDTALGDSVWIHKNDGDIEGGFSRGVALREASKLVPRPDAVLFHCDVDMIIQPTFFTRCRHNSVQGAQVYYPVFYSLYPYANAKPNIVERNGFWRKTSFGMTCIRKSDFEHVGAFLDAETRFHGWGSEDVYQFEKIRNVSSLAAFRAVEPALMHRWHSKACDSTTADYVDCMKTNFMTMGHPLRVGPLLLASLRNVDQFLESLEHV